MACIVCDIVPPHLLEALAQGGDGDNSGLAARTLEHTYAVHRKRHAVFEQKIVGTAANVTAGRSHHHAGEGIVPDHLLEHIATSEAVGASDQQAATETLKMSQAVRDERQAASMQADAPVSTTPRAVVSCNIFDSHNQEQSADGSKDAYDLLPGTLVLADGQPLVEDRKANEAYTNSQTVLDFYRQVLDFHSLDNNDMPVISSIHFKKNFQNAQWWSDGSTHQMVYGDGGGFLYNFTACLDVIAHEMTHAVTEHTSNLKYKNEAGALNEHVSDVFGIMVRQWKSHTLATWLIGEGCFMPEVKGVALRNMKAPGTGYDDPKFGKDPQQSTYGEIEAYRTKNPNWYKSDYGQVHMFSGVRNRAFVLCAEALQGYSWEKAGKIWWLTITSQRIPATCTFSQFADATVDVALGSFDSETAKVVRSAWDTVGVFTSKTINK